MIRKAFVMSINPGAEAEYVRRHSAIWPELKRVFRAHGVTDYSIFLLPGHTRLFALAVVESAAQWAAIAETPECIRWWQYMADLMPHKNSGEPIVTELKEVFLLT
ncbi:MAG: L-rhamnose mutarotase [Pseudomonadota bacterium]|jgi:L-rhamnose mutarotase|nr:L-rhamnose mutarotase [Pseudomonadota bacterium]